MLQERDESLGRKKDDAPAGRRRISDDSLHGLIERLRHLGFEVPPLYGVKGDVAGGVPMRLGVRSLLRPATTAMAPFNAIRALLEDRTPFTLTLSDLGEGEAAIDALQRFCERLRTEIATSGRSGKHVGICIHAQQLPLQAFKVMTDAVPGGGPRYVILDGSQLTMHGDCSSQSETDQNWSFLWRHRMASDSLMPAYGAMVRTACPLLAGEAAASILPGCGIQVPVDSAWLPVKLSLTRFADAAGEISWSKLLPALAGGVDLADKIMDRVSWSRAAQQSDAILNRRLALSITGLGDLVLRRGLDPQDLDALRWLSAIVIRIRKVLWHISGEMARTKGCLPVFDRNDPSTAWCDSAHRKSWQQHWRAALKKSAVRHRNMLVLSPYDVLPSDELAIASFTDLLPAITCADAWSFADVSRTGNFNLGDYKTFHRRAWAVIQGCKTGTLVAAGV